eukprot:829736-Karenia_brevis.AAC.1
MRTEGQQGVAVVTAEFFAYLRALEENSQQKRAGQLVFPIPRCHSSPEAGRLSTLAQSLGLPLRLQPAPPLEALPGQLGVDLPPDTTLSVFQCVSSHPPLFPPRQRLHERLRVP